jgi:glycerophosphoryl diester phosphodiesterase
MGHSGLTGYDSDQDAPGTDVLANSWATGTNPDVDSVYQRVLAENPAVQGHVQNFAIDGSTVDSLVDQEVQAAAVTPAVSAILAAGASQRVLVSSFSESRRAAALRALPGVVSSSSARRFVVALLAGKVGFSPALRGALRGLVAVQIPERALGLTTVTERMLRRLHAAGVEVHVWTVNDPQRMRELLDLGVDGLVTDRIDLALEVVRTRR